METKTIGSPQGSSGITRFTLPNLPLFVFFHALLHPHFGGPENAEYFQDRQTVVNSL
ncbi:MAG: hypothetical protein LBQ30_08795 [Treponema sp.]|jgi:hypothetical protein|nr:hypothetical protein [Treponema sp.]